MFGEQGNHAAHFFRILRHAPVVKRFQLAPGNDFWYFSMKL